MRRGGEKKKLAAWGGSKGCTQKSKKEKWGDQPFAGKGCKKAQLPPRKGGNPKKGKEELKPTGVTGGSPEIKYPNDLSIEKGGH